MANKMWNGLSGMGNNALKDQAQLLTELFMRQMSTRQPLQAVPVRPQEPSAEVAELRCRLMMEEVFETVENGFDCRVYVKLLSGETVPLSYANLVIKAAPDHAPDLIEIADGLADLDVVGPCGSASACGIAHEPIYNIVAQNNLMKFAPGHSFRADGKLLKPAGHPDPKTEIGDELIRQGWDGMMPERD